MEKIISIKNLFKFYGKVTALNDLTLNIENGKIIGLLGPNGSGKTALIKILMGLQQKNKGEVKIFGLEPGPETKSMISFLPDQVTFNQEERISDTLDFYEDFFEDFDRKKATDMLNSLGLNENKKIKECSKGMQEKLMLSLCLSRRAKIYILDEPLGAVDPATREYILQTIMSKYNQEATLIISTHLIQDVEPILTDFIFIKEGSIVRTGNVKKYIEENDETIDALFRKEFKHVFEIT